MKNIVAGNWKSNKLIDEAQQLFNDIQSIIRNVEKTEVIIAPPLPYLGQLAASNNSNLSIGAQQTSAFGMGAFTGEVTSEMLKSVGVTWVIIGHSERREGFGETNEVVRKKVRSALNNGLKVILCCGENLSDRQSNDHFEWVGNQLRDGLSGVSAEEMNDVVIAYEPIWAIGTGQTASSAQAQEMHAHIRGIVKGLFGETVGNHCRILYGGSCKPDNAQELFSQPDVNGGLIGGASLQADSFAAIVSASEMQH